MDDMDVDPQPAASSQPNLNAEANISALSSVLSQLETSPDNVPLIKRQIRLMKELQMSAEVLQATEGLASLVMLSEGGLVLEGHVLMSRYVAGVPRRAHTSC